MSNTGKVLIIDDEANLRNTLQRILQKVGCETVGAADGNQALKLLSVNRFDLIYLDIHLPNIDGIQILKEIRSREPNIPVIILTGYGSLNSSIEALRLGAIDYMLKPFDPEILAAQARMVLEEQVIERRKREIRDQINILQAELLQLELDSPTELHSKLSTPFPEPQNRFLKLSSFVIDRQAQRATFGDIVLNLPPSAFDYLVVLANHSPDVVDYQALVIEAQQYDVGIKEARELSKWHVHVLRKAIEDNPQKPKYIINVRGIGYRLLVN